jgi:hypothetical protein
MFASFRTFVTLFISCPVFVNIAHFLILSYFQWGQCLLNVCKFVLVVL